jgi:hypothetical protein
MNKIILKWRLTGCGDIQLAEILTLILWYLQTIRPFWTDLMNILQYSVYNLSNTATEFSMVISSDRMKIMAFREQNHLEHGTLEVCIGQVRSGQWRKKFQNIS